MTKDKGDWELRQKEKAQEGERGEKELLEDMKQHQSTGEAWRTS